MHRSCAVLEVVGEPDAFLVSLALQQGCDAMLAQFGGQHPGEQARPFAGKCRRWRTCGCRSAAGPSRRRRTAGQLGSSRAMICSRSRANSRPAGVLRQFARPRPSPRPTGHGPSWPRSACTRSSSAVTGARMRPRTICRMCPARWSPVSSRSRRRSSNAPNRSWRRSSGSGMSHGSASSRPRAGKPFLAAVERRLRTIRRCSRYVSEMYMRSRSIPCRASRSTRAAM